MLYSGNSNIKVFACNSNKELAESIVAKLGLKLGDCEVEKFSDGEISVKINETIRGADVFIIQSTSYPVNDNLMELLIMIDAMKILIICIFIDVGLSSIITGFPVWPLYLLLVLIAAVIIAGIIASVRAR